jgi:hypothetical protein
MDRSASRPRLSSCLFWSSVLLGMWSCATAAAQAPGQGRSTSLQGGTAATPAGADRRGAKPAAGVVQGAGQPRKEPSEAYRESIRQTVEKRRQRRANRGQGMGDSRPLGGIVPWPMPPALIIRHTPQVHDEIESFLTLLRK